MALVSTQITIKFVTPLLSCSGLFALALVPVLAWSSTSAAQDRQNQPSVSSTCAACMNPGDGLLRVPCSAECRKAFTPGDSHAVASIEPCRGIHGDYLLAVSFPPDTSVLKVLDWWHMITCQKFLVPRSLGSRRVNVFPYSVTTFDGTRSLILAILESVGLALAPDGQYQRVTESPGRPASGVRVLSRTAVEQLVISATVTSEVRPSALVHGPKESDRVVRIGDRIGKKSWRLAEIHRDQLVVEAPGRDTDGGVTTVIVRAIQPQEGWQIGQGAVWSRGQK